MRSLLSVTTVIALTLASPLALARKNQPLPEEVTEFLARRAQCDHFRGEEPYSPKRAAYIAQQLKTFCTGTDARLAELKAKYKSNASARAELNQLEDAIEGDLNPDMPAEARP